MYETICILVELFIMGVVLLITALGMCAVSPSFRKEFIKDLMGK